MRLPIIAFFAAVTSIPATNLQAQEEKRPIVAEDLYRLHFASEVAVSPDGRWVAHVVSRADSADNTYRADLWLAAADGSCGSRPPTGANGGASRGRNRRRSRNQCSHRMGDTWRL
jgi:hypothetical protein